MHSHSQLQAQSQATTRLHLLLRAVTTRLPLRVTTSQLQVATTSLLQSHN